MPPVGDRLTNKTESVESKAVVAELTTAMRIVKEFFENGLVDGGQSQVASYIATNRGDLVETKAWLTAEYLDADSEGNVYPNSIVNLGLWTQTDMFADSLRCHLTIDLILTKDGTIGGYGLHYSDIELLATEELRLDAMKNVNETLDLITLQY